MWWPFNKKKKEAEKSDKPTQKRVRPIKVKKPQIRRKEDKNSNSDGGGGN